VPPNLTKPRERLDPLGSAVTGGAGKLRQQPKRSAELDENASELDSLHGHDRDVELLMIILFPSVSVVKGDVRDDVPESAATSAGSEGTSAESAEREEWEE